MGPRAGAPSFWLLTASAVVLTFGATSAFGGCSTFSAVNADSDAGDATAATDASDADGGAAASYAAAVLRDGPIAYFRLDDVGVTEGQPIFDDVSDASIGVVHGTPAFGVAGATTGGHAVSFDGMSWIDLGPRYGFANGAKFTIELFVKPAGTEFGHLFTKQQRANPKIGYAITLDDSVHMERYVADMSAQTPGSRLSTTAFWSVVCTYDAIQMALYVNGQLVGTTPDARPTIDLQVSALIASASAAGENGFHGTIDELAIYDKVLTPAQILAHFTAAR